MSLNRIISKRVCALFLCAGFLSVAAFRFIGSSIDSEGVLHEPFPLIPIGWLCFILGIIIGGLYLIRTIRDAIPLKKS